VAISLFFVYGHKICPKENVQVDMIDRKYIGKGSALMTVKVKERQRKLYNEVLQYSGQSQHIVKAIDGLCKTPERKKKTCI
jgi:hypothetical protein